MRKRRSKILDAVSATARGLHAADAVDQLTMREFDQFCLKPVLPLRPAEIKRIRESEPGGIRRDSEYQQVVSAEVGDR